MSFEEASMTCSCLRSVFPGGYAESVTFDKVYYKKTSRRKRSIKDPIRDRWENYHFLVSLSIPAYSDDTEQKLFACNGLVQSTDILITSKTCVQDESEWYNLTVRSESPFWSQFGREHSVIDVSDTDIDGLVQVQVWPEFSEFVVPSPSIKYPFWGKWVHASSIGWDENMYEKNLTSRYKYELFDVDEWTSQNCSSESSEICYYSDKVSSRPLVTSCHQLIAMKSTEKNCFNGVGNFTYNTTEDGTLLGYDPECQPIYNDDCSVTEAEVCES
ncbi:hypothetical protein GEV33_011654 [Tenebrio molitor]|uniref:Uncharacterized protein n=1 Tax=Tenebrio molitor TaxID=7067 RepID=A0A8J6HB29_TENMO|nr:hypothetical protein GEV33_011654 [Tenebrio molitor]